MKRWPLLALLVALAACTIPVSPVVNPPQPQPAPAPTPPAPPEDVLDAKHDAFLALAARVASGPVTEPEVDAVLGRHVLPAPYTQVRAPFHRIVTYAVRSADGKASLRVHVHFATREGAPPAAVPPLLLE